MSDAVALTVENCIATLTLDVPEQTNIVTPSIATAMRDHLDDLEQQPDIRCVVIEGSEDTFCVGGDVEQLKANLDSGKSSHSHIAELEQGANEMMAKLVACSYPTVAKVAGPAVGAGANLAIGCDIALASESASIGFGFNRIGLSVDTGTSYLLPRLVGMNKAKELVFTGEILGAREATELGLFNHVYPDDEFESAVAELVGRLANGPTVALRQSKQLLDDGFEKSFQQALHDEAVAQSVAFESDDHCEGLKAFLETREPDFEGE